MPDTDLDTSNHFYVGILGDTISILRHVPPAMSREHALNLAAWLAVMAGDIEGEGEKFDALRSAIRNL